MKKNPATTAIAKYVGFINQVDAHHKLYISVGIGLAVFFLTNRISSAQIHIMWTWIAYALSSLALAWVTILTSHPADVKYEAHAQDSNRKLVFTFVVIATFASLFAILILLQGSGGKSKTELWSNILIPLMCVIFSWLLVHTVFTLRYAHFYYCDMDHDQNGKKFKPEGLIFPNESQPDYLDFTYFSFVIGMTFQVSDVQITSRRIRRLALMHGVLSFAFNTVIVAFTINIIAGLIQK